MRSRTTPRRAFPGAARLKWLFNHTHIHTGTHTCNLQAETEPICWEDNTQRLVTEFFFNPAGQTVGCILLNQHQGNAPDERTDHLKQ